MLIAAAVALGLRLIMFQTRAGVTMRAVVDHRGLATLVGARPARSSMLSWALGSSLAAVAGILLAPVLQLNVQALTLLVVNAYAAAMVGRLRSVPLTFVGALVLGLAESYAVGYLPSDGVFANVRLAIPTLMLFIVLLLIPEVRLRGGSTVAARMPRLVSASGLPGGGRRAHRRAPGRSPRSTSDATLTDVAPGLALGLIALSMVPLTGWAGQVSLCQMTFAGHGRLRHDEGRDRWLTRRAARRGRDRGARRARWSPSPRCVSKGCTSRSRPSRSRCSWTASSSSAATCSATSGRCASSDSRSLGVSFESDRAYFVLLATAFALCAVGLLALRRGRFGRRLSALRDSQVACTMMGMNTTVTKLQVFALSSAIAAVGGVLLAGLRGSAGAGDYTMFSSLPLVLLAVLGGITAVSGALVGGLVLAGLPVLAEEVSGLEALAILLPGIIGVTLARRPDGIVLWLGDRGRRPWTRHARPRGPPAAGAPRGARVVRPLRRGARPWLSTTHWRSTVPEPLDLDAPTRRRSWSCAASGRATGASRCCTASTSSCLGARSSGCSDRTAPARAPRSASSPARSAPPRVPSRWRGATSPAPPPTRWPGPACARSRRGAASSRTSPSPRTSSCSPTEACGRRQAEDIAYERFPLLARAPSAAGGPPVGRRAADARARPCAGDRSGAAAARRAVDGARRP